MRRFIIVLVLLIIASATVFLVGYTPLRVEPGTVVVMYSRTSGWDSTPIQGGEFRWQWEFLIPTNTTLVEFDATARTVPIVIDQPLPSAAIYAPLLADRPDLSQRVSGTLRYRMRPEALAELAPQGSSGETSESYFRMLDEQLETTVVRALDGVAGGPQLVVADLTERVLGLLESRHPGIEILSLVFTRVDLPDTALYELGRESYQTVQRARLEALAEQQAQAATDSAERAAFIETLESYGRILTEYPVLLDYLEIAARNNADPLDLADLQALPLDSAPASP